MNMKKKLKLKRYLSFLLAFIMLALNFISLPTNHNVNKVYAAPANNIVISEAYGGGGNKGAEYKNDFIELYNPTSEDIDISGWSVQYASATGSFTNSVTIESGTIMAGGYYLIQAIAGNGGTKDLPTPDLVCTIAMGASNFKVRITDSDSNVVDLVGAGSASEFEGTSAASAPSNTTSIQRKDNDNTENGITNGWDTDDNGKDFYTGPPTPRNSQSGAGEETVTDTVLESIESARVKISNCTRPYNKINSRISY